MPNTNFRQGYENPQALVLERNGFSEASLDGLTKPPSQDPDSFVQLDNVEPVVDSRINRRRGYLLLSNPTCAARRITEAHYSSGADRLILAASDGTGASSKTNQITAIENVNGSRGHATNNILIPSANATVRQPSIVQSRAYAFIMDGGSTQVFKRWDGVDDPTTANSVTDWGMSATGATFTATPSGSGDLSFEVGRRYMIAFLYTTNGENQAVLYDISSSGTDEEKVTDSVDSGPQTNIVQINLASLPTYTIGSSGFIAANMSRVILATADGGALDTLYEVGRITDNTTTTFVDDYTEEALLASPIWAEITADGREIGIYDNVRPSVSIPNATLVTNHRGRLYAISEQFLFFSKSLADLTTSTGTVAGRYECCWPPSYQIPIAIKEEFGRGILSDGIRLYIATDRGIRVLDGDFPYFSGPRTLFNEVGLLRQDTWKTIYHEGLQIGAIWMTPDRRIIASDFNTYGDIGRPIQHILDAVNVTRARAVANAVFVSDGPFELYMIALPAPGIGSPAECDTLCVYDVVSKRWYVWYPAETNAGLAVPGQGIFAQATMLDATNNRAGWYFSTLNGSPTDGRIYRWHVGAELDTANNHRDRNLVGETPVTFAVTLKTAWLDWGLPQVTKLLNELEVLTGDSGLTVTVEGASTDAGFASPTTVLSATAISAAPFSQYKISLAAKFTKFRFYRFTFTSPASTTQQLLDYFACEAIPYHRF